MKSIELFSGTGGLALGLHQAGFSHEALFEWDKDSCDNIKHNIANGYPGVKGWSVFQTDVRTVSHDGYTGKIQFVAGDPPCQPFSLGGKHQAYNDKRDMFPEAVRAVRETQPKHSSLRMSKDCFANLSVPISITFSFSFSIPKS
jgi:DNA (cytosine-5)-methyltransferase 1